MDKTEEAATKRRIQLASQYINGQVVFLDGFYRLLIAETNDMGRARTLKADYVALGLSVRILSN